MKVMKVINSLINMDVDEFIKHRLEGLRKSKEYLDYLQEELKRSYYEDIDGHRHGNALDLEGHVENIRKEISCAKKDIRRYRIIKLFEIK